MIKIIENKQAGIFLNVVVPNCRDVVLEVLYTNKLHIFFLHFLQHRFVSKQQKLQLLLLGF